MTLKVLCAIVGERAMLSLEVTAHHKPQKVSTKTEWEILIKEDLAKKSRNFNRQHRGADSERAAFRNIKINPKNHAVSANSKVKQKTV